MLRPRWVLFLTLLSIVPLIVLGDQARKRIGTAIEERAASDASSAAYAAGLARQLVSTRMRDSFRVPQRRLLYQHLEGEAAFRKTLRELWLTEPLLDLPQFVSQDVLRVAVHEEPADSHLLGHEASSNPKEAFKKGLLDAMRVYVVERAKGHLGYDPKSGKFRHSIEEVLEGEDFVVTIGWFQMELGSKEHGVCEKCVSWAKEYGQQVSKYGYAFSCVIFPLPGGSETETGVLAAVVPIKPLLDSVLIPSLSEWTVLGAKALRAGMTQEESLSYESHFDLRLVDRMDRVVFDSQSIQYEGQSKKSEGNGETQDSVFRMPLLGDDSPWRLELRSAGIGALASLESEHRQWTLYFFGAAAILILGAVLMSREILNQLEHARLRSHLLSNISHELKTPLSLIRLYADTLESDRVNNEEERHKFLGIIGRESKRLTHLIDNVLDVQRIEEKRKTYSFAQVRPDRVVRNTVEAYRFQLVESGFELKLDIDDELPLLMLDEEAMAQAIINLIDNATKYSDAIKEIRVRCYRNGDNVCISVADRGIGIAAADQEKIFDSFYRAEKDLVHNVKGSGLGLPVVRHVAEAHGGNVQLESTVGKGSTFTICCPVGFSPETE